MSRSPHNVQEMEGKSQETKKSPFLLQRTAMLHSRCPVPPRAREDVLGAHREREDWRILEKILLPCLTTVTFPNCLKLRVHVPWSTIQVREHHREGSGSYEP